MPLRKAAAIVPSPSHTSNGAPSLSLSTLHGLTETPQSSRKSETIYKHTSGQLFDFTCSSRRILDVLKGMVCLLFAELKCGARLRVLQILLWHVETRARLAI